MNLLNKIKETRRQINLHSIIKADNDTMGLKYYLSISRAPRLFLEALSQLAKEKSARVYAYVKEEKKAYEFTPSKDRKEVYIVSGNKYYTMTENYTLIENIMPLDIKNIHKNTPVHWIGQEK